MPESGTTARRVDLDWARGLAVLVMIQAHVLDAWTRPTDRTTQAFHYLNILSGFAAPLFLWLAGVASVVSAKRTFGRTGRRSDASSTVVRRGLGVFALAVLFRLQSFLFNPGGPAATIFRVDILNILGPGIMLTGVLWSVPLSRPSQVVLFASTATVTAMVTPIVRLASWVDALPAGLQWYVRPSGDHTVFTLFPWLGFVFAGVAVGVLTAAASSRRTERLVHSALGAIGVVLCFVGFYTATLPTIYRQSSYWTSSPTFFALRSGVLLLVGALLYALARLAARWNLACLPLQRLGRASLFIYWIHVPIVYGWVAAPLRRRLSVPETLVAFLLFSGLNYATLLVRDRLREHWAPRGPGGVGSLTPA